MKTLPPTEVDAPPAEVYYPCSESMPETTLHMLAVATLLLMLRQWFKDALGVYVTGNIFWYYKEGDPKIRKSPDIMVAKGVERGKERRVWKDWEEGVRPSFVLEVVSADTLANDLGDKKDTYEALGVHEYFLFDPDGIGLEAPLIGFRRINGVYEPLQISGNGTIPSSELGLRLKADGERVALLDMRTGKRLPEPAQLTEELATVSLELVEKARVLEEIEREAAEAASRAAKELEEQSRLRIAAEQATLEQIQLREKAERGAKEQERLRQEAEQATKEQERLRQEAERGAKEQERLRQEAEQATKEQKRLRQEAEQAAAAATLLAENQRRERENERRLREEAERELERLRALLKEQLPKEMPPPGS